MTENSLNQALYAIKEICIVSSPVIMQKERVCKSLLKGKLVLK